MTLAPRFTRVVPAPILGLAAGVIAYFGLGALDPALLTLNGNALVIGSLRGQGAGLFETLGGRWKAVGALELSNVYSVVVPAITLAVLLSIDTLKTCVVLDALTRSRHDSNRTLIGQGLGNLVSAAIGGVPGAGTMG